MWVGLYIRFVIGMLVGLVLGVLIFLVSLIRGRRAVHAEGVVVRAEVTATDAVIGPRLAGPAIVRLSGALHGAAGVHDILGLELRLQTQASQDPAVGDQDLVFGTFHAFKTASADTAHTDAGDYLANRYSSVTPWWTSPVGAVTYHLAPPPAAPRGRGVDRVSRLVADLGTDRARLEVLADHPVVAELRLVERLDSARDAAPLRVSMFRCGRGVRPVGVRNGIRAVVYPISQAARRLRGG
jgi:hypothetical protein